jgi:hypothetical protein
MGVWIERIRVLMGIALLAHVPSVARGAPAIPNSTVTSNFFFIVHSNASSMIWVAPPTWKVMRDTAPPTGRSNAVTLHAARNEYEPVQVVVRATTAGTRALSLGNWAGPSAIVPAATLHDVSYGATACTNGNPDRLEPIAFGAARTLCAGSNHVFWLTVFVPTNASAGVYSNTITCTLPGTNVSFPIRVHVFDFTLPAETAFGSLVDFNFSGTTGDATEIKRWFHQHRLTPRAVTWPSGMQHNITWDNLTNPSRCTAFYDEGDQPALFSIRSLAQKFVAGSGFNDGVGFPNFIAQTFINSTQPRPTNFCGQSITGDPRGAQYGTAAYNAAWSNFLAALQKYCDPTVPAASGGNPFGHDYLSKAIYFVMNEPQDTNDYNLAAWLAQLSRQAAPKLRLMISEEAKPEIYNNPLYPGQGYDIWLAHLPTYSCAISNSLVRKRDHGEQTWWYSLPGDPAHFINPNQTNFINNSIPIQTTNRPVIETRMLTWLAWHHRVEGWSTSPLDVPMVTVSNGTNLVPTIRSELLREAMEDYEYFKLANGGQKAAPFQTNHADRFVSLIASSLTGFDRDPSKLHWLRLQLGRQISGEGASLPLLPLSTPRPYGSYAVDFGPGLSAFTFNGRNWIAIGWQFYDPAVTNAGWYVPDPTDTINPPGFGPLRVTTIGTGNTVQQTLMYDDFNRPVTFIFALANGTYDVGVCMGWPGLTRNQDQTIVTVNGIDFFGNRLANSPQAVPLITSVTNRITVVNESLVLEVGDQITRQYSIINYLTINAVSPSSPDGLDDAWQTLHFGSATNVLAAPNADPDGDRASNWLEFHSGTNPNSAASRPQITATFPATDSIELAWTSATNHLFRLDRSTNLSIWNVASNGVSATNGVTRTLLPRGTNAPQEFFRVIPLAP